jgi:hypothetical protein
MQRNVNGYREKSWPFFDQLVATALSNEASESRGEREEKMPEAKSEPRALASVDSKGAYARLARSDQEWRVRRWRPSWVFSPLSAQVIDYKDY